MSQSLDPNEVMWNRMTAETLRGKASEGAMVLLPVASTEQHGPHLATGVDTFLCTEACRLTALELKASHPVVVAPCVWMGLAEHHMEFGGTFSLSLRTWHSLLEDLCRSIQRHGFTKIAIINGHGGNMSALNALTTDLTRDLGISVATTTYLIPASHAGKLVDILEDQTGVIHACEAETSMMMHAHPDLVEHSRLEDATGHNSSMSDVLEPPIHRWHSFKELTPSGVLGDARRSTPEKGDRLFKVMAETLAEALLDEKLWPAA